MKLENEFIGFIENLLHEHDCIIIPNFGGFVVKHHEFQFIEDQQVIIPQKKTVAFNEKLKNDDGILMNEYSTYYKISNKKASQAVKEFVDSLKAAITQQNVFTFGTIGSFSLNEEKNLQFIPNPNSNFNLDMFGLKEVAIAKKKKSPDIHLIATSEVISSETSPEELLNENSRGPVSQKKRVKNSVYAFLFFIVAAVSTFVLTEPGIHFFSSSLSPIPDISKSENIGTEKIKPNTTSTKDADKQLQESIVEQVKPVEKLISKEEAVQSNHNTIELIVGSFLSEKKAKQGIEELASKGIENAYIIPKKEGDKYYRISMGNATSLEEGYQQANEIKKQHKLDIWVFENNK